MLGSLTLLTWALDGAGTCLLQERLAMEIPQGDLGTLLYMTWNPITRDEQNCLRIYYSNHEQRKLALGLLANFGKK